jgi:hypothetical protein
LRVRGLSQVFGVALLLLIPQIAWASEYGTGPLVQVSGASPFGDGCGHTGQTGINYPNTEVEPWVEVNPANPANVIGAWQQDRWSNGGSRGNVVGFSTDGGVSWALESQTKNSECTGGTLLNGGDYDRASDPWVSISPNGTAYLMSLSVDHDPTSVFGSNPDAMLVSRSTDGGDNWGNPITLIRDDNPNRFNDKNSMTADPKDSRFVYAVWDRLVSPPSGNTNPTAGENAIGYRGPTLFARTIDGGESWEPARIIYDPGTLNQTIGNQIVVLPNGDLVDLFALIYGSKNADKNRGVSVAVIRSQDKGATWSQKAIIFDKLLSVGISDPDDGNPVRTADIIPEVAVDPRSGQLYAVWQDARFSDGQYDSVALSTSATGGRTWSDPVKVNKTPENIPPGNQQAFTPSVDVADDGTVSVSYYDFRNNTGDRSTLPTDYWAVHCHPATVGGCSNARDYGDEIPLTDTSFDMENAPIARGYFVGDYEGLANAGPFFGSFFSQTESANDSASIYFRSYGP